MAHDPFNTPADRIRGVLKYWKAGLAIAAVLVVLTERNLIARENKDHLVSGEVERIDTANGKPRATVRLGEAQEAVVVLPSGTAVLNADDEMVAGFADLCDGRVIFFSTQRDNPVIVEHLDKGERAVCLVEGRITLLAGQEEIKLCRLVDAPMVGKAKKAEDIATALAGTAAGWALGLSKEILKTGLKTHGVELPDLAALMQKK